MSQAVAAKSLLHDPIQPTLWRMTWPVIIGVLTLISFNVVDTFFVGMLGTDPLAAVSFYLSGYLYHCKFSDWLGYWNISGYRT